MQNYSSTCHTIHIHTLLMRVTAELIYTHIDDLIWSFVKEK